MNSDDIIERSIRLHDLPENYNHEEIINLFSTIGNIVDYKKGSHELIITFSDKDAKETSMMYDNFVVGGINLQIDSNPSTLETNTTKINEVPVDTSKNLISSSNKIDEIPIESNNFNLQSFDVTEQNKNDHESHKEENQPNEDTIKLILNQPINENTGITVQVPAINHDIYNEQADNKMNLEQSAIKKEDEFGSSNVSKDENRIEETEINNSVKDIEEKPKEIQENNVEKVGENLNFNISKDEIMKKITQIEDEIIEKVIEKAPSSNKQVHHEATKDQTLDCPIENIGTNSHKSDNLKTNSSESLESLKGPEIHHKKNKTLHAILQETNVPARDKLRSNDISYAVLTSTFILIFTVFWGLFWFINACH